MGGPREEDTGINFNLNSLVRIRVPKIGGIIWNKAKEMVVSVFSTWKLYERVT